MYFILEFKCTYKIFLSWKSIRNHQVLPDIKFEYNKFHTNLEKKKLHNLHVSLTGTSPMVHKKFT